MTQNPELDHRDAFESTTLIIRCIALSRGLVMTMLKHPLVSLQTGGWKCMYAISCSKFLRQKPLFRHMLRKGTITWECQASSVVRYAL